MIELWKILRCWHSLFAGLSFFLSISALSLGLAKKGGRTRELWVFLLIVLVEMLHVLLVRVPFLHSLWTGSFHFGPGLCQGTCVSDMALAAFPNIFICSSSIHYVLLGRLPRNAGALSFGLAALGGFLIGLRACAGRRSCFGYFPHDPGSADWISSLGTNGLSILTLITVGGVAGIKGSGFREKANEQHFLSFGVLIVCCYLLVNLPRSIFYFYSPPSTSQESEAFALYFLTRILPDTQLLHVPLGLIFLLNSSSSRKESEPPEEDEFQNLLNVECPGLLLRRIAQSPTTTV